MVDKSLNDLQSFFKTRVYFKGILWQDKSKADP